MVLDTKRKDVEPLLLPLAKGLNSVTPDILTWISLIFAFVAGEFFYFSKPEFELSNYFLLLGALFVFLNGLFDAIDGKVAKITNKISEKGDFLDHAIDRFADVLLVGGLILSSWCRYPVIGFLAIVGILLTSYMGTQAQAVGYKRNYSGLLGRADRIAILIFIPIIQHLLLNYPDFYLPYNLNLIEWVLIYFALMGNITAVQRFISTLRWFNKKDKSR